MPRRLATGAPILFQPATPYSGNRNLAMNVIEIARRVLENEWSIACTILKRAGAGTGANGLTPDSIKFSEDYRSARASERAAFKRLRKFNASNRR